MSGLLAGQAVGPWRWPAADLVALARRHRIEPMLYARLVADGTDQVVAPETLAELGDLYRDNSRRVLRSIAWLQQIIEALAGEGIEARPLKGVPLAAQAYQRIADRHCGDIDLLVPSERQRRDVEHVLEKVGLQPPFGVIDSRNIDRLFQKADLFVSPDCIAIEIHYHHHGVGQHVFPTFFDFSSTAWQPCNVESVVTHRLHGLPLLLYLLSHGTRGMWRRLKWLLDIHQLTRDFETVSWNRLVEAAADDNLGLHAEIGLRLLRDTFDIPASRQVREPFGMLRRALLRHCRAELGREVKPAAAPFWAEVRDIPFKLLVPRGWQEQGVVFLGALLRILVRHNDLARWRLPLPMVLLLSPLVRPFSMVYRYVFRPLLHRIFGSRVAT